MSGYRDNSKLINPKNENIVEYSDDLMINKSDIKELDIDECMSDSVIDDEEQSSICSSIEENSVDALYEFPDQPIEDEFGNLIWKCQDDEE